MSLDVDEIAAELFADFDASKVPGFAVRTARAPREVCKWGDRRKRTTSRGECEACDVRARRNGRDLEGRPFTRAEARAVAGEFYALNDVEPALAPFDPSRVPPVTETSQ